MRPLLLGAAATPTVNINLGKTLAQPSSSLVIILAVSLIALAPFLLLMLTGFTRIIIVLGLTRSAMGITVPPNQVLVGVALFLSLFLAGPTISQVNHVAVQPYLHGHESLTVALKKGELPVDQWMLKQTGKNEIDMVAAAAHESAKNVSALPITTVIPAFLLSQLEIGFLIGFVIFIPFFIIDLIVSATLMSVGIVMLPPTLISLPFKIMLFVLVDGWALVAHALLTGFR